MVWGFGPNEIPTWNRKIQFFSQKWIFGGKFEFRTMPAHKFFVRYRKIWPKRIQKLLKKGCAAIAQTSYQALKKQIFKFLVRLGGRKLHMGIKCIC